MRTQISCFTPLLKPTAYAAENNIDIICMQEPRYYYNELELKYYDASKVGALY